MEWVKNYSACNRIFFASYMPSSYQPDLCRLFYLNCAPYYSLCCSFVLNTGEYVKLNSVIPGNIPVIVFCHGTASNIGTCYRFSQRLAQTSNCHVLMFDYPGYGLSRSYCYCNEEIIKDSIRKVLDHLIEKMQIPVCNIILCGHSLGTAVAVWGMKYCQEYYQKCVAGLILLNPFTTLRNVAQDITMFGKLIQERLCTQDILPVCQAPILIVHGQKDEVIPVQHGITLYNLISGNKDGWFPSNGTHDHCEINKLYFKIWSFIQDNVKIVPIPYYINDTPRIDSAIIQESPTILTQIGATTVEVLEGIANESLESCWIL